jgi:hypothetical protein
MNRNFICCFAILLWVIACFADNDFFMTDSNTVGLWRFNEREGAIVHDVSGNNNHGTIVGAQWTNGLYGGALSFDGIANYVSVPHSASLVSPSNALTVEALIWVESYNAISEWSHVLDKPHTYALSFKSGTPAFAACGVGSECWWAPYSYLAPTGKWLHVAAQFDGENRQIYVNDSLVAESAATGSIGHLDGYPISDLVIGAGNLLSYRVGSTGYFFHGIIDEVRISKTARYGKCTGFFKPDIHTIALYPFDEGKGTVVQDISGNNNNGTIVGALWTKGLYCGALRFDGTSNYVSVPHSASLVSVSNAITLEAFVWISGYTGLSEWTHIMDKPHTYSLSLNSATPAFAACGVGSECWWKPHSFIAPIGKWVHIAAQFDGQKRQIFVDDALVAESFATGTISHLSGYPLSDLVIGAGNLLSYRVGSTGYFFYGVIDEVRISDIARYKVQSTGVAKPGSNCKKNIAVLSSLKSSAVTMTFQIDSDGPVSVDIFNCKGNFVKRTTNEYRKQGSLTFSWDGRNEANQPLCAGQYIVRLRTMNKELVSRIVLSR